MAERVTISTTPLGNTKARQRAKRDEKAPPYFFADAFTDVAVARKASCPCGGGCPTCRANKPIQTKLTVGEANDEYEREADRVADQVIAAPENTVVKTVAPRIQRLSGQRAAQMDTAPASVDHVLASAGSPLEPSLREDMEQRFGHDFSEVRVHTDKSSEQSARDVHANAYTSGHHIVFGAGQFSPGTKSGRRLLAHELTHVVQQGGGSVPAERLQRDLSPPSPTRSTSNQEQPAPASDEVLIAGETIEVVEKSPGPPDDRVGPAVSDLKWVFKNNKAYWSQYNLDSVKPLRNYDPFATPNAYANRVYRAQKYLRAGNYIFREKKIALDGMLGPQTILFLQYILQNENFSEAHFELTGLGFDREALNSAAGRVAAHQAETDEFPPKFLEEWAVETEGTVALSHMQDDGDLDQWYDRILFGGVAPQKMHNLELTRAHRHAIMLKAYENVMFKGLAALVEVERDALDNKSDNLTLIRRHYKKLEDVFWINYAADTKGTAARHDKWFKVEYPTEEIRQLRKAVGSRTKRNNRTYLTGLLTPFFIPQLTVTERTRLQIVASEYFRERAGNIENFIGPRAAIILSLIRNTDMRREIRAHRLENELMDFFAHADVFEKFADHLVKQGNFEELLIGIERLRSVGVLELFVQLCMQTPYKKNPAVLRAHEGLMTLKRDIRSHDYVAGDSGAQAVILEKDPDRKLKVGEVAGGRYIISEDRERMKPDRQKALEEKMRALVMADIADKMGKEDDAGGEELSEEKYMEKILEKAAAELKIGEKDFEEVSYEEGYRLLGVKSVIQNGVEQFLVEYEKVNRMAGGAWQAMEGSSGYRTSRDFEESLGWFKFANQMGTLETLTGGVAIVVAGVVLLTSGAGGALIALGGGAKLVGLSIGISVLIWAITSERWTIEGFLNAVLDGYLMAVGFRAFSFAGRGVAKLIGTATFKQKLVGLLLQSVVTGGGAGAMTGPASLLIRDILAGKLGRHSAGDYFNAAKTGFVYGALFELGGSLIIGPLMRTAGKNVLERIVNIEQWKEFIKKSGIVLKPTQWGSEITKSYAGFKTWLGQNLEATIEQTIAKKFLQYSNALLENYVEGFLLTIHRQTLDLIETGMTKEAVNTLEKIITESHKKLPVAQANALVNEVLNHLARNPKVRVNPFFSLVNVGDNASFQAMLGPGMKDLASSDAILQLATVHPPAAVRSLWQYHFQGNAAEFTLWLEKAALLPKESGQEIIRLLTDRGSSVNPALLLRMAQKTASFSVPVVDGLVRLTTRARQLNMPLSRVDEMLASVSDEHLDSFLKAMNDMPPPDFDSLSQRLLNKPADAGKTVILPDTPTGAPTVASDVLDRPVKTQPPQTEPVKNLPGTSEPVKPEPVKGESVEPKTEPEVRKPESGKEPDVKKETEVMEPREPDAKREPEAKKQPEEKKEPEVKNQPEELKGKPTPEPTTVDEATRRMEQLRDDSQRLSDAAKADGPSALEARNRYKAAKREADSLSSEVTGYKALTKEAVERNPALKNEYAKAQKARQRLRDAQKELKTAEREYTALKAQQDARYEQIRKNNLEAERLSRPELNLPPTQRGTVNEARVLKEEGLLGIKPQLTVRDPKTGEYAVTIPDAVRPNGRTVDVKDVLELSETQQLRLQREYSRQRGQKPEIITGTKTKVPAEMEQNYIIRRRPDLGPR